MGTQRPTATEQPSPENSLVLLVDVQGRLASLMHESRAMIRQQRLLIQASQYLDVPIVWAEQVPDKLGPTVAPLAELLTDQTPCHKVSFGCCEDPGLLETIQSANRPHIILAGIETHVCVWQTAATLLADGYAVHVVEDAISSRYLSDKVVGLKRMYQAGGFASSVEMVIFGWMGNAKHPQFRAISQLIKQASAET